MNVQNKKKVKYNEQEIKRDLINLSIKQEQLRVRGKEFKGKIIDCTEETLSKRSGN